jgi:hypothetical protein
LVTRTGLWIATVSAACAGLAAIAAAAPPPAAPAAAARPDAKAVEFFETKVRPLLSSKCVACHTGASAKGKLDLRSREAVLKGGEQGPSVVPGNPDKSLLIQAVRYQGKLRMPLGTKLSNAEVETLTEWVRMGAPWGLTGAHLAGASETPWAFQPVREPRVPAVANRQWAKNDIDRFVLSGLEKAGLKPSPYADRRTLLRRATFDLTGLPPTPEEVEAFLGDRSPDAWEKVVDRLLASPHYGERWGRHWLDVVRYSDSNGLDWNEVFPNAWRYRDYVIKSFNQDKPFDQFIKEQLAGDQLPARNEEERNEHLIATGVLVMGPKLLAQQDRIQLALDVADEQIDLTSKAFLGLTVSCARCHDHKFDPISTKDYYALAGIFKSTVTLSGTLPRNNRVMYWMERPLAPDAMVSARKAHDDAVKKLQDQLKKTKDEAEKTRLSAEIKALEAKAPPAVPMAMAVQDGKVEDLRVHVRGSYKNLGDPAPRGFLTTVAGRREPVPAEKSGRLELAEWIASPENPLTARVLANRVWLHHFGRGIVATPDNFGRLGERPSHPELLDYLSRRLVEGGWSLKKLHRQVMLSATYQMSSDPSQLAAAKDPENRLLWRMNRSRLEAEAIRDSILLANGQLDRKSTGGTLVTRVSGLAGKEFAVDYNGSSRRSVYLPVVRGVIYDMFLVFDFADPHVVNGRRDTTTVAPQALYMMNSPYVQEQAGKFADLLLNLPNADDARRVETAYLRALNRPATSEERTRAQAFIDDYERALEGTQKDPEKRRIEAWRSFCQALYASSEFRYVD